MKKLLPILLTALVALGALTGCATTGSGDDGGGALLSVEQAKTNGRKALVAAGIVLDETLKSAGDAYRANVIKEPQKEQIVAAARDVQRVLGLAKLALSTGDKATFLSNYQEAYSSLMALIASLTHKQSSAIDTRDIIQRSNLRIYASPDDGPDLAPVDHYFAYARDRGRTSASPALSATAATGGAL